MSSAVTVGSAFKKAVHAACVALFAADESVLVSFGASGQRGVMFDDVIGVADLQVSQSVGPMSSTNRSREETLTLTVWVSAFMPGDADDLEEAVSDRAFELLGMIEHYVRQTDTTLGGVVRDCALTEYDVTGFLDSLRRVPGRTVDIEATLTAHARVSGP